MPPLSKREIEVLQCKAKGMTNKEVGKELCIEEQTVKDHQSNINKKLDVGSAAAAVIWAKYAGLIKGLNKASPQAAPTPRETEIGFLLAEKGFDNAQLAAYLSVSVPTVKGHLSRMLAKFSCANRVELAAVFGDIVREQQQ